MTDPATARNRVPRSILEKMALGLSGLGLGALGLVVAAGCAESVGASPAAGTVASPVEAPLAGSSRPRRAEIGVRPLFSLGFPWPERRKVYPCIDSGFT